MSTEERIAELEALVAQMREQIDTLVARNVGQGGGAGPGVNAPGSARAPLAITIPGSVFISPPPLEPWPPGDPGYAAVKL